MIQRNNQPINSIEKIEQWEEELSEYGFIKNENLLLKAISHESNPENLSRLLTVAALSRLERNKQDSLAIAWLEKALDIYPNNNKAKAYFVEFDWKKKKDIFDILTFPAIRETDNRTAKKRLPNNT